MNKTRKLDIVNVLERALVSYKQELKIPLTKFIFQTPLHWNVVTIVALATFKDDYSTSFQDLCKQIPSQVGSKSSIQNIIEDAVQKNYFKKTPLPSDKRIKALTLTDTAKRDYERWLYLDAGQYFPDNLKSPF